MDVVGGHADAQEAGSVRTHVIPLFVATVAYSGIILLGWLFQLTSLAGWQREHLHWNYVLHTLFILVPIIAIPVLGRSAKAYGLRASTGREGMIAGATGAAIFLAFVLVGVSMGALEASASLRAFPISTVVYQLIFVAIFEEVFFRGFLQHELGRFRSRGGDNSGESIFFGWILTALLFGLGHGLGGFNPFLNSFDFEVGIFLTTFVFGCVLGLLRARSGSIWPAVLLHLAANISTTIFLQPVSGAGQLLLLMGFFTALPLVVFLCMKKRRGEA